MTPIDAETSRGRVEAFSKKHRIALLTMLFTDIVGSTQLKQLLGDRAAIDLIGRHHALIRDLLTRFVDAEEISTAGDSFFIVFAKPSDAAHFALLMQNGMRRLQRETGRPVLDRVGIHVGEIFVQQRGETTRDLFGIQIDTAARVMSLGGADQILLSRFAFDSARQILRGADIPEIGALTWLNHGYYEMKGVEEPVEVCEAGETGLAALTPPGDSQKAHRFHSPTDEPVLGWRPAPGLLVPATRWMLERNLGEGGFGEVWLARHEQLKQERVIKFCFNAERARSLKREVTLFRVLRERVGEHPNIVAIHDVFFEEAPFYIVMDYVEGPTFDRWAAARPGADDAALEPKLEVIAQVADALQAAHDSGIIHRDIKPSNVLVTEAHGVARAKLTDFGVGQVVNAEALAGVTRMGFTQTMLSSGSASGTQIYMAPEVLSGQPATTRSDIYSLGVVLWQMITGDFTRALTIDWAETVADPLLREDIQRCVAGDPQKRFAGVAQLAERLRTLRVRRAAREREKERVAALERRAYRRGVIRSGLAASAIIVIFAALALFALRQKGKTTHLLAMSDLSHGQRLFEQGEAALALPFLARAVESSSTDVSLIAADRLWFALAQRSWPLPVSGLVRHDGAISSAEFSPDGLHVMTASADGSARLWKAGTGTPVGEAMRHAKPIQRACFSPDGRYIVTACFDGTARLWDAKTAAPVASWSAKHEDAINAAVFGAHGDWVATGARDGSLRVWSVPGGEQLAEFHYAENVHTLVADPANGDRFLGVSGRVARVWSVAERRQLFEWTHDGEIACADFSGQGQHVVTAGKGPFAQVWNSVSGAPIGKIIQTDAAAKVARFSPDGTILATASGSEVYLWTPRGDPLLNKQPLAHAATVTSLSFRPDSAALYTGSSDGKVQLWNLRTGKAIGEPIRADGQIAAVDVNVHDGNVLVATVAGEARVWRPASPLPGGWRLVHPAAVEAVAMNPQGRLLLTACKDGNARLWDIRNGLPVGGPLGHRASVVSAAFSPDGKYCVTGSVDSTARVWLGENGSSVGQLAADSTVVRVSLSPDGQRAATGTETGNVQLYEIPSLHPIGGNMKHAAGITGLAFNRDGRWLVTGSSDGVVRVWNPLTGGLEFEPARSPQAITLTAFNPVKDVFAVASRDGSATLIDRASRKAICPPLVHQTAVLSLAFSPDGRRLATGSEDGTAVIWDAATGHSVSASLKHSFAVSDIVFSPDSLRVATASEDGTARLWDAGTGQPLSEPLEHAGPVRCLSFSPDGAMLFTGSVDGKVGCWQLAPRLDRIDRLGLASFARALSPVRLEDSGRLEPQVIFPLEKLRAQARRSSGREVSTLLKWFFSAPADRAVAPRAQNTTQAYIDARIDEGTALTLDEAELLAGGNPAIRGRIEQKRSQAAGPPKP
jgi:WD40 repeat protein/class 3 adenylate cyclase/tRNA A-37 threonylcarbamoyl transferase component Bud32